MASGTKYKPILVSMMSHMDNQQYPLNHEFTAEHLSTITPVAVLRWMNMKAFGTSDPPVDANPTLARSNSLKYWKKALSFFMPN